MYLFVILVRFLLVVTVIVHIMYALCMCARNSLSTTLHSHADMIVRRPAVAQQHTRRMRNLHNEQSIKMLPHVPRFRFQRKIKLKACEPRPTDYARTDPIIFPPFKLVLQPFLNSFSSFFLSSWRVCNLRRSVLFTAHRLSIWLP